MIKNNEIRLATDASGYPICQISNGTWQTAITSGIAIVVDKWQRVSCTYDGANLKIYVNGNLTGTRAETNVVNDTTNGWRFGSDEGGTYGYFLGLMDDVKIYNRALSSREISYLYNQGKPSAEWQFRANYNDTGSWCAENGLCKNLTGGGTGNSFGLGFLENGTTALALNGSGYASIADDNSLDMIDGQDFSISAWVKMSDTNNSAIAAKRNGDASSDTGYLLGLDYGLGDGKLFFEVSDGTNEFSLRGATSVADGTWKNVIAVFDDDNASNCKIFVNGQEQTVTQTGTLSSVVNLSNAVNFEVGAESDAGGKLTGSVDTVRVYKYALTAEDLRKEYNGGAPMRFGARSATSASAGTDEVGGLPPVAWWKFDEKSGTSCGG